MGLWLWFHTKSEWNPSITAIGIYSTVRFKKYLPNTFENHRKRDTVGVVQVCRWDLRSGFLENSPRKHT